MTGTIASTKVQVIAAVTAMLLISGLVIQASSAAFSGTVENQGNAFETGSLNLDSNVASAMFEIENMVPGQTATRCVNVTYNGSIADPAGVKLYSTGYTDSGTLGEWLNITVEEGDEVSDAPACTGFGAGAAIHAESTLDAFDTARTDYSNGAGAWDPAATPEVKAYRFTVELDAATPDGQEGASVTGFGLTWEVQAGS